MTAVPKVSIVIPVYNSEKTIQKCVESLVYGNYKNIEVILIDDQSTDNSWHLCEEMAERYSVVFCFKNPENKGVSYTRNHGISKATGDYIMFVDSDDWVSCRYVESIVNTQLNYSGSFIICGHYFLDENNNTETVYLWENGKQKNPIINKEDWFKLVSTSLLKQVWDKLFERNIVVNNQIYFDTEQNMGEDFQFVLEYLEACKTEQCVIVNQPLYYYIRSGNTSLMSGFGLFENNNDEQKLQMLLDICGKESQKVIGMYESESAATKHSYVYWICHNKKYSKAEKLEYIEKTIKDGKAFEHYRHEQIIMFKEKVHQTLQTVKKLPGRSKDFLCESYKSLVVQKARKRLINKTVALISQDNQAKVFYDDMHIQYCSPTIGTYISIDDFLKFASNLEYYLTLSPFMKWHERSPKGILGDITIYFLNSDTCSEAFEEWESRKKLVSMNNTLICAACSGDLTDQYNELWRKISYAKVLFSTNELFSDEKGILYTEDKRTSNSSLSLKNNSVFSDKFIDCINAICRAES